MIHEYDLLNALIGGKHKLNEAIDPIVAPLQGVVDAQPPSPAPRGVRPGQRGGGADGQKVVAIVTKIDLIEFLAAKMA